MPASDASRIARLDERIEGVREDVYRLMADIESARKRIHQLEGIAGTFVDTQKSLRGGEAEQYRRLAVRIQIVGLLLALAAIISPILVVLLAGK